MTYLLTTIEVQGSEESVFEIYADESREQTLGYALEEKTAVLWNASSERITLALAELREMIDGGEEAQGDDSRISHVMGILEGDQNHLYLARKDHARQG